MQNCCSAQSLLRHSQALEKMSITDFIIHSRLMMMMEVLQNILYTAGTLLHRLLHLEIPNDTRFMDWLVVNVNHLLNRLE